MAVTLPYNGPAPSGSGGSIIQGQNVPSGASVYAAPFIRFQPSAVLVNTNNVVDLVMPGGPNNPQTWYTVVYTVAGGVLT